MLTRTKFGWLPVVRLLILAALPGALWAQDAEQRGLEIAEEADARNTGWNDSVVDLTMTLRNKNGDESVREMRSRALEVEDDGDKSMIIFDQPRDVRGTALLTYSHKTGDDDQWLYLPALKRVKRIASSNKSGPFMGSEFAAAKLSSPIIIVTSSPSSSSAADLLIKPADTKSILFFDSAMPSSRTSSIFLISEIELLVTILGPSLPSPSIFVSVLDK